MNKYRDEIIETLKNVIKYNTVLDLSTKTDDAPFGIETKKCLDYVLKKASSLGFTVKNGKHYGYAEYGEGEELILILAHLDIVPVGDLASWNSDPFTLTSDDEYFYGRGVSDDKGPAILSLFAVKSLIDDGVKFNKRVRVLFGLNEETGMECVKEYVKHEELPTYGFTPDSDFPVCYGEKGIMGIELTAKITNPSVLKIRGGMASNAVASSCEVILKNTRDLAEKVGSDAIFTDDAITLKFSGVSAHASTPDKGVNAIDKAFKALKDLKITDAFILDYVNYLCTTNASTLGADFKDDFGALTFNVGVIKTVDSELKISIDVRYPITMKGTDIFKAIEKGINRTVYDAKLLYDKAGVYFPLDSDLVKICLSSYQDVTGDKESKPYTMGGGTYARSMPNLVAIGGAMPGSEEFIHAPNERAKIEDFFLEGEVHKEIIKRLLEL